MKTKKELDALRDEVEALNKKLSELTDEELKQVTGGHCYIYAGPGQMLHIPTIGAASEDDLINPDSTRSWFSKADSERSRLSGGQQQRINIAGADIEYQLNGEAFKNKENS